MRTTLNIDDDVLQSLKEFAETRSMALGKAASDLVRRGLAAPVATSVVNGLHVVTLPPHSPSIGNDHVRQLLEDEI
jgi:hypothetical protein